MYRVGLYSLAVPLLQYNRPITGTQRATLSDCLRAGSLRGSGAMEGKFGSVAVEHSHVHFSVHATIVWIVKNQKSSRISRIKWLAWIVCIILRQLQKFSGCDMRSQSERGPCSNSVQVFSKYYYALDLRHQYAIAAAKKYSCNCSCPATSTFLGLQTTDRAFATTELSLYKVPCDVFCDSVAL